MNNAHSALISSYLAWWSDAGIIDAVGDGACDWLSMPAATVSLISGETKTGEIKPRPSKLNDAGEAVPEPQAVSIAAPARSASVRPARVTVPMPNDLAAFDQWLGNTADLPGADWSAIRLLPHGPADAPLMVLADAPDLVDFDAGQLLSGAAGRLLDAMLAAIGLKRDAVRVGSMALTRPIGGRLEGDEAKQLARIAMHHIALARPRNILLLGQQTCQLLTGENVSPDGHGQREINLDGGKRAVSAIHHPRLLLERPLLKRPAWTALKRLKELN